MTPAEWDAVLQDAAGTTPAADVATAHGVTSSAVRKQAARRGIRLPTGRRNEGEWRAALVDAERAGLTRDQTAKLLGTTAATVGKWAVRLGIELDSARGHDRGWWRRVLTDANGQLTAKEIGNAHNRSPSRVHEMSAALGIPVADDTVDRGTRRRWRAILQDAHERGLTAPEVAREQGVSDTTIRSQARLAGLRLARHADGGARTRSRWEQRLRAAEASGKDAKSAAEEYGVHVNTVLVWSRRLGIDLAGRTRADEANHARWERALTTAGGLLSPNEIATREGASPGTVSRWSEITGIPLKRHLAHDEAWWRRETARALERGEDRATFCSRCGVTGEAVRGARKRYGIPIPPPAVFRTADPPGHLGRTAVIQAHESGPSYDPRSAMAAAAEARLSLEEFAARAGVALDTVRRWSARTGITLETDRQRRSRLIDEVIADPNRPDARAIATRFGISVGAVHMRARRLDLPYGQSSRLDQAALVSAASDGLTKEELAERAGVPLDTVQRWSARTGITLETDRQRRSRLIDEVIADPNCPDARAIATRFGTTIDSVYQRAHKAGVRFSPVPRSDEDWRTLIQGAADSGEHYRDLARRIGLHVGTVYWHARRLRITHPASRRSAKQWSDLIADVYPDGDPKKGPTAEELADQVGVAPTSVSQWALRSGIHVETGHTRGRREHWERINAAVLAGSEEGATAGEIARRLAVSVEDVYAARDRLGVQLSPGKPSRASRPSDERLAALARQCTSIAELAGRLGVASSTAYRWCAQASVAPPSPAPDRHDWDDPDRLAAALGDGMQVADIARIAKVDRRQVAAWLADYGIDRPKRSLSQPAAAIDKKRGTPYHGISEMAYLSIGRRRQARLDSVRWWLDDNDTTMDGASPEDLRCWVVAAHRHGYGGKTILECTYAVDAYIDDRDGHKGDSGARMRDTLDVCNRLWRANTSPLRTVPVPLRVVAFLYATDPVHIAHEVSATAIRTADVLEIVHRAVRVWFAVCWWNAARAETPGHLRLVSLATRQTVPLLIKGNERQIGTGHSPGHLICPACNADGLLNAAPHLDPDTTLGDLLPNPSVEFATWLKAAGLDPDLFTIGSARTSRATIEWVHTHDRVAVGRLLQHRSPGGPVTVRYIQRHNMTGDLSDPDYDLDQWVEWARDQALRRRKHRELAGKIPATRLSEARSSQPITTPTRPGGQTSGTLESALGYWIPFLRGDLVAAVGDPHDPDTMHSYSVLLHSRFDLRPKTVKAYVSALARHLSSDDTAGRKRLVGPALAWLDQMIQLTKSDTRSKPALLDVETVRRCAEAAANAGHDDLARMLGWGWGTATRPGSLYAITTDDVAKKVDGAFPVRISTHTKRRRHDVYDYTVRVQADQPVPLMPITAGEGLAIIDGNIVTPSLAGPLRPGRQAPQGQDWARMVHIGQEAGLQIPNGTTPMTLRHSSLTALWEAERDLLVVQMHAGHRSPHTTFAYLSLVAEAVRSAAGYRMADAVHQAWTADLDRAWKEVVAPSQWSLSDADEVEGLQTGGVAA